MRLPLPKETTIFVLYFTAQTNEKIFFCFNRYLASHYILYGTASTTVTENSGA